MLFSVDALNSRISLWFYLLFGQIRLLRGASGIFHFADLQCAVVRHTHTSLDTVHCLAVTTDLVATHAIRVPPSTYITCFLYLPIRSLPTSVQDYN